MVLPLRGLAFIALSAVAFWILTVVVNRAAKHFAAQRMAAGEWDENGPKHRTEVKPWEHVSPLGYIGLHLDDVPPSPAPDVVKDPPADTQKE